MKISEGLKLIQDQWVRKPQGFRVRYERQTENGIEEELSPPDGTAPLNSDVTAWRYAWKLWQATLKEYETEAEGALYNITVVDDLNKPTRFYGTGDVEIYNPKNIGQNAETDP